MFSTFKGGGKVDLAAAGGHSTEKILGLRQQVEINMRHSWEALGVKTIWFDDNQVETNIHGTPVLRSMYLEAFRTHPNADTYTYVNGDLLTDDGFVRTADAVVWASRTKILPPRFLVVGQRTNVDWVGKTAPNDFEKHMGEGKLFQKDAQDYFIVTKDTFDWRTEIPAFVIGRPAYDNWLVNRAYHDAKVALIDATGSIRVIHQTDHQGNYAWKKSAGESHNRDLGNREWDHGTVDHSEYTTFETDSETGEISLVHRQKCQHSGCHDKNTQKGVVSKYSVNTVPTADRRGGKFSFTPKNPPPIKEPPYPCFGTVSKGRFKAKPCASAWDTVRTEDGLEKGNTWCIAMHGCQTPVDRFNIPDRDKMIPPGSSTRPPPAIAGEVDTKPASTQQHAPFDAAAPDDALERYKAIHSTDAGAASVDAAAKSSIASMSALDPTDSVCTEIQGETWARSWNSVPVEGPTGSQAAWSDQDCASKLRLRPKAAAPAGCVDRRSGWEAEQMQRVRQIKDSHKGERCVLIANGPSLNKMRWDWQDNFKMVMGMNKIYIGGCFSMQRS